MVQLISSGNEAKGSLWAHTEAPTAC